MTKTQPKIERVLCHSPGLLFSQAQGYDHSKFQDKLLDTLEDLNRTGKLSILCNMALRTCDGSLFILPELNKEQMQSLSPVQFTEEVVAVNAATLWESFNPRNLSEVIYHMAWNCVVDVEPRSFLLPPFPAGDQDVSDH